MFLIRSGVRLGCIPYCVMGSRDADERDFRTARPGIRCRPCGLEHHLRARRAGAAVAAGAGLPGRACSTITCWRCRGARPIAPDMDNGRYDPQCHGRERRPYAFVLHGLWPQFEQRWPEFCRTSESTFVPEAVAQRMLDIMPSKRLIFHEYRKHGTCSGLGVDGYFDLSRRLYRVDQDSRALRRPAGRPADGQPGRADRRVHGGQSEADARHDRGGVRTVPATASRKCASASTRAAACARAVATRTSAGCAQPSACTCRRCASAPSVRRRSVVRARSAAAAAVEIGRRHAARTALRPR